MPEGPSIVLLREQLAPFAGGIVREAQGTARLDLSRLRDRRLHAVRSWGKHLLFEFEDFSLRMHLQLFGRCRIDAADAPPHGHPTLRLRFDDARIAFQAAAARWVEGDLDTAYDWSADLLSPRWDPRAAHRKLRDAPDRMVCDVLLDQAIFSGAGNIMRNEVLFRMGLHPLCRIVDLDDVTLDALIAETRAYAFDFLAWKRRGVLRQHWQVHEQRACPRCGRALALVQQIGRTKRRSVHCGHCQHRHAAPALFEAMHDAETKAPP